MSILKLDPGTKVTMAVKSAEQVEGKFGPQIKFAGTTPGDADAAIFLNVDPAFRQLDRIGFSVSSVIGQTVEFERVEKNGTKFTNINKLHGAGTQTQAATVKPTTATNAKQPYSSGGPLPGEEAAAGFTDGSAALPTEQLDAIFRVYDVCFQHAFSLAERTMKQDASHEGISAMAATCFIAARDRGIGR